MAALVVAVGSTIYVVDSRGGGSGGGSISQNLSTQGSTPNLAGDWKQSNSNSSDSYQEATITGLTIEINWVSDGGDTKSLYWTGSFAPPTSATEPYKWTSNNDTSKTNNALVASGDSAKDFTYQDGTISYSASALGTTTTIKLKKKS